MSGFPAILRVASYNIFKARHFESQPGGAARRAVLDDVSGLASLREADVLALQEAIVGRLGPAASPARDTVAEIAARLGVDGAGSGRHWSFRGVRLGRHREWGVGLVTRAPAVFQPVRLPKAVWSPWQRNALLAEVGPWLVVCLHLEVWPVIGAASRRRQIAAVLEALDRLDGGRGMPAVLAGDFNCQPGDALHGELRRHGFAAALPEGRTTFRLGRLGLHLDHIYARGARVLDAGVETAARGSDHWPIWATLAL
jgi:endonuclease/exonuclease/phosphatase family metal-dependent hydrolase